MKRYLITIVLILALIGVMAYRVMASSVGPTDCGTGADDATVGTKAWGTPTNGCGVDGSFATWQGSSGGNIVENSMKIVQGGTIGGTEHSTGATQSNTTLGYNSSYGSSSDLWGLSWTATDINASTFGFVYSLKDTNNNVTGHYLKVTNFGFSIPAGATINGIFIEVDWKTITGGTTVEDVDNVRATITYTSGTPQVQIRQGQMNIKSGSLILK